MIEESNAAVAEKAAQQMREAVDAAGETVLAALRCVM